MKHYNIEAGSKLKLESYVMRVVARNKKAAAEKVKRLGFNAGIRLSTTCSGEFKPTFIHEIKKNKYARGE